MNTDGLGVLILYASAALIISVLLVPRSILVGPFIFGLIGASSAVSYAMVFCYDMSHDRVDIDDSLPLVMRGALLGLTGGFIIMAVYQTNIHKQRIEILIIGILYCSVGAIFGWLAGDKRENNPPMSMLQGAAAGAIFGIIAGFAHCRTDSKEREPNRPVPDQSGHVNQGESN